MSTRAVGQDSALKLAWDVSIVYFSCFLQLLSSRPKRRHFSDAVALLYFSPNFVRDYNPLNMSLWEEAPPLCVFFLFNNKVKAFSGCVLLSPCWHAQLPEQHDDVSQLCATDSQSHTLTLIKAHFLLTKIILHLTSLHTSCHYPHTQYNHMSTDVLALCIHTYVLCPHTETSVRKSLKNTGGAKNYTNVQMEVFYTKLVQISSGVFQVLYSKNIW